MSRKDALYRGTQCLNCQTPLDISERYCHYCGQLNSTKKYTVSDFIEEFFANFYAYDSKIKNTFTYLFTKPAFVAKQIIKGRRQSFANPFRLFLSIVLIYFLTVSFLKNDSDSFNINENAQKETLYKNDTLTNFTPHFYSENEIENDNFFKRFQKKADTFSDYLLINPEFNPTKAFEKLHYKDSKENRFLYKKTWLLWDFSKNPTKNQIIKEVRQRNPFIVFLFLPSIAFCFFLVFNTKEYTFTDNLIFVYTLASVYYLILFFDFIILELTSYDISNITILLYLIYLYKSLRKFYNFSRWITIYKFVLLNIVTLVIGFPTLVLLIFLIFLSL